MDTQSDEVRPQSPFVMRGKEAVRLAEARLTAQSLAIRAAETRAIAIVGWSVIGSLAALAVVFGTYAPRFQLAAIPVVADLCCVAVIACFVLWPRPIGLPGMLPSEVLDGRTSDELEDALLYSIAEGYAPLIKDNTSRLSATAEHLRWALGGLACAPVLAIVSLITLVFFGF